MALASVVLLMRGAKRWIQRRSTGHLERSLIAFVLAATVVATGACSRVAGPDPHPTPDLARRLEQLPAEGAVGLLQTEDRIWRGASGETKSGRSAQPQDWFGIASITKTFVATAVLQLVDDGLLSLDDSIEDVLPGALPYGQRITVRQLLNHSSGLDDGHVPELSPRKILEVIAETPPLSRPGAVHGYANVNYIVLGVIVEEVTGQTLEQVVRSRIIAPLRLDHTSYGKETTGSFETEPWLGYPDVTSGGLIAAGGIVSTADDVATFFRSLLGGQLIRRDLLAEMTRTIEADGDDRAGLGIFELELSCGSAWGHGGELPTYSSMALASHDGSRVVVVAQNSGGWTAALDVAEEIYCS